MDDMSWFMLGLNKGRKEGGSENIGNMCDIFLAQPTELEVPLIGEYKQVFKFMPDNCGYTTNYQFSDYSNKTAEGHLFAVYKIAQYKPYAVGMFRGDEYLGIGMLNSLYLRCETVYSPKNDYTEVYLNQNDVFKRIYGYELGTATYYSYYMVISYTTAKADIERTTYTSTGEMTKEDITETVNLPGFGSFFNLPFPYADDERVAECIVEYANLCNTKYHELN